MPITDEEIRERIRGFRVKFEPEDFCNGCPFDGKCQICYRIFKMMPPGPYLVRDRIWELFYGYKMVYTQTLPCPCCLYDSEYTAEKIMEFMGE